MQTERAVHELPRITPRLSAEQLADLIGVSIYTLQRWRTQGTGPDFEKFGNQVRYRVDVVEAWMRSQSRSNTGKW